MKASRAKLRIPGKKGILPQDCNIEVLSEFPNGRPDLWILDLLVTITITGTNSFQIIFSLILIFFMSLPTPYPSKQNKTKKKLNQTKKQQKFKLFFFSLSSSEFAQNKWRHMEVKKTSHLDLLGSIFSQVHSPSQCLKLQTHC